jgi:hypothetical protein
MDRRIVFFIFVSVLAGLSLGSVRKSEDPVRDTQTDPILYEKVKEEEKDGKKGALLYHVKNSPRETFFIDPPFEKAKKSPPKAAVTEEAPAPAETAGWWEEQSTEPQAVSPAEKVAEPLPELVPEAEKAPDPEVAEQPAAVAEAEKAPSGKGDDYWW